MMDKCAQEVIDIVSNAIILELDKQIEYTEKREREYAGEGNYSAAGFQDGRVVGLKLARDIVEDIRAGKSR